MKAVAAWHGLDEGTVKNIDREILEHKIQQAPKGNATFIGVDEIAHKKGHVYMTVITDLKARRVVDLQEGRKAESLGRFFRYLGPEHCADMQAVVVDRWRPYRKAIQEHCPQALIIYDKFHVIQDCNDALERLRRRLQKQLPKEACTWLKHSRWALLKRPEKLSENQQAALKDIEKYNRPLYRAYLLKEQLRAFYSMTPEEGESLDQFLKRVAAAYEQWRHSVMYSRINELKSFVRKLSKDKTQVLNYFIHRLSNGLSEGMNSVIRQIQRRANGYRDKTYFALKIYQKAGILR